MEAWRGIEGVGRASGVSLPSNAVETPVAMTDGFEPGTTSSMQRDVEAGNLFELEAFSGTVVRLGKSLNSPTPVHQTLYTLLRPKLLRAGGL